MTGTNFALNYHLNQYSKLLRLINCKFPKFFKTPPIFTIWKSTKQIGNKILGHPVSHQICLKEFKFGICLCLPY